jgi:enterochelin esterase family protein
MIDALDKGVLSSELPPMILVMPYMGTIGQLNQFPPDPSYERVILEELLPAVERNFCIIENPSHMAIAGISRGGFWAYSVTMRHPEIFGIAAAHSGFFPNDTGEIPPSFNPLEMALNSSSLAEAGLRLYLDNGASDSSGPSVQLLSSRLAQRNIQHTYVVNPTGEHDNDYWSQHVREYLDFYSKGWDKDYTALPSCADPSP